MKNLHFVPVLMSVASKTKTKMYTTAFLGILVALSAFPTWANTLPGSTSLATVDQPVVSTQTSNQDLSVLRSKLKERFSGVAQEITSLVKGQTTVQESFHGAPIRTMDVRQGRIIKPVNFSQDFFIDIGDDPYRSYINRLAAYGVLSSSQKFYPQNYFRVDDFLGLLQKLYMKKFNAVVPQAVLSLTSTDGIMTKWQLQQIFSLLPMVTSVDIDGNPYDKLMRSEGAYYLVRMFDLPILSFSPSVSFSGEVHQYFTDTLGHPFASAINTLASLGIVSTHNNKFYPDNYLRHYDFVLLFVNAYVTAKGHTLPTVSSSSFADVETNASYLPQLVYGADRGLLDELITSKRGQLYFSPTAFVTKKNVYNMLRKALDIQFVYDPVQADQQNMTRAEVAELLVESLGLKPAIQKEQSPSNDVTLLNKLQVLLSML